MNRPEKVPTSALFLGIACLVALGVIYPAVRAVSTGRLDEARMHESGGQVLPRALSLGAYGLLALVVLFVIYRWVSGDE